MKRVTNGILDRYMWAYLLGGGFENYLISRFDTTTDWLQTKILHGHGNGPSCWPSGKELY